ncbi:MAG: 3-hydroxyacyl-CoA dehydrogenase [Planctomycetaceae bacterium]
MSRLNNVMVAGAGVMGSQVAWMAAVHGKNVVNYDAFPEGLERGKQFHDKYALEFVNERGVSQTDVDAALARITYTTDLAEALRDADIIIEQVPEALKIKQEFWEQASKLAPKKTIFCTNTSSLLPSAMLPFVDRPEKFLTLHFCVKVWDANVGEVMATPKTSDEAFKDVSKFAEEMGLVPIEIQKEQPGYVLNSLLIPFGRAAIDLVRKGVATPELIDKTWLICMANKGPLQMMDMAGMNVLYHVFAAEGEAGDAGAKEIAQFLKADYIDQGKTGLQAGEGFYKYQRG